MASKGVTFVRNRKAVRSLARHRCAYERKVTSRFFHGSDRNLMRNKLEVPPQSPVRRRFRMRCFRLLDGPLVVTLVNRDN